MDNVHRNPGTVEKMSKLREEVEAFARTFPMPGFDEYWFNAPVAATKNNIISI